MTMNDYHMLREDLLARASYSTMEDAVLDYVEENDNELLDDHVVEAFCRIVEHITIHFGISWQGNTG